MKRLAELISPSPLLVACGLGLSLVVVEFGLYMRNPLVALVLFYGLWITANYFFEIVEFKALGHDDWPVFSQETLVAGKSQIGIVFSLVTLAAGGAYVALLYLGWPRLAEALLVAGLAGLPTSVALLAVTRDFASALNPLKVFAAAAGMGVGYLYCLAGGAAILGLLALSQSHSAGWYFPLFYGLFLQAYLIGSVVYARRNALGVSTPRSPEARAERAYAEAAAARGKVLTQAYGFAAHGNLQGAMKHIEAYLAADDDTLEARLETLKELARWEDKRAALEFGKRVIAYCERHGLAAEAARVRSLCEHLMPRESIPR